MCTHYTGTNTSQINLFFLLSSGVPSPTSRGDSVRKGPGRVLSVRKSDDLPPTFRVYESVEVPDGYPSFHSLPCLLPLVSCPFDLRPITHIETSVSTHGNPFCEVGRLVIKGEKRFPVQPPFIIVVGRWFPNTSNFLYWIPSLKHLTSPVVCSINN